MENRIVSWQEGKSLIFDDTFLHEVWKDTDGYRLVLFLDIAIPLKFSVYWVNWLSSELITGSHLIKEAKINHERWEKEFESITNN